MRVAMVARDIAPSGAFQQLAEALKARGIEPALFVGGGKPLKNPVEEIVKQSLACDIVLLGMSSAENTAKEELAVVKAAYGAKKSYGFYKDIVEGSAVRAHFDYDWLKNNAAFLLVRNNEEVKALKDVFPNARIVASGNPLIEDSFFPRLSRAEVRSALGIGLDEKVIFCTGTKLAFENFYCFVSVLEAVYRLSEDYSGEKFRVIFSMHPGDTNLLSVYDSNAICFLFQKSRQCLLPRKR